MPFDPGLRIRLEYADVSNYVRPDRPDWMVPNRSGDRVGDVVSAEVHRRRRLAGSVLLGVPDHESSRSVGNCLSVTDPLPDPSVNTGRYYFTAVNYPSVFDG